MAFSGSNRILPYLTSKTASFPIAFGKALQEKSVRRRPNRRMFCLAPDGRSSSSATRFPPIQSNDPLIAIISASQQAVKIRYPSCDVRDLYQRRIQKSI